MMPGFTPKTFTLTGTLTKSGNLMLKQTEHADEPAVSAAQVRVTPEELAAALSHLEAGSAGRDGKIAIGKAVEELSLDAAPEDILRAVEVARQQTSRRRRNRRRGLAALLAGLAAVGGVGVYGQVTNHYPDSNELVPASSPFAMEPRILALNAGPPRQTVSTLAEVPDGKTVYCSVDALGMAAMSRNVQMGPLREPSQPPAQLQWPVVKYGHDLYVRGWVRMPLSKQAAKLSDIEVFNNPKMPQLGASPQQVTFNLDSKTAQFGLAYQRLSAHGTGRFTFHEPQVTEHTYEKWNP